MEILLISLGFVLSLLTGVVVGIVITYQHPLGDLRVDRSDTDGGPLLFLELDADIAMVMRKKYVTFRVKMEDFIPHE